jgi:hypothetical protein
MSTSDVIGAVRTPRGPGKAGAIEEKRFARSLFTVTNPDTGKAA